MFPFITGLIANVVYVVTAPKDAEVDPTYEV